MTGRASVEHAGLSESIARYRYTNRGKYFHLRFGREPTGSRGLTEHIEKLPLILGHFAERDARFLGKARSFAKHCLEMGSDRPVNSPV